MSREHMGDLRIIAGPCSVNENSRREIDEIARITVRGSDYKDRRAIFGTRVVGLKSRTALNPTGKGMGMDHEVITRRIEQQVAGKPFSREVAPSALLAEKVVRETGLQVATEVMLPSLQVPDYIGRIPAGKLLLWNPSVKMLGWDMLQMTRYAEKHGWGIGIKNGKSMDVSLETANDPDYQDQTSFEKMWLGMESYAHGVRELAFIHRGVEVSDKGDYRNAIVHELARKVKHKVPGALLYFDPSHTCGPRLRNSIVDITVDAMRLRDGDGWLYDGILIEAGTSATDTDQHISIAELGNMAYQLNQFRHPVAPTPLG